MILLKLFVVTLVIKSNDALSYGNASFYIQNLIESRLALPTLERDIVVSEIALFNFEATDPAGYGDENAYLNISQLVTKAGYPFEAHFVTTKDGYILQLHRIPGKGPVALLNHGIVQASDTFVLAGPESALAYYLADRGYDVWMFNARGNKFSKRHIYLTPDQAAFWNFTIHEIGIYDLPATFDYIRDVTGQEKINYVGFSQGTSTGYILCGLLPEYNNRINVMVSLAPVSYFSRLFSPVLRFFFIIDLFRILYSIGLYDFLPNSDLLYAICNFNNITKFGCINFVYFALGYDSGELNYTNVPVITSHILSGCSVLQFDHYKQIVNSGRFRQYDVGRSGNLRRYGMVEPPDYPLEKVTTPVALMYGLSDFFVSTVDVALLREALPNVVLDYPLPRYDHVSYVYGRNINNDINSKVVELFEKFSGS